MKIVADENIAGLQKYFAEAGSLLTLPGRQMTAADVAEADVLLVRSVTRVDRHLLQGSKVRFVGSCTIGTDHLDIPWLEAEGITWAHAPGCNARAVVDYVLASFMVLQLDLSRITVGIVGCGYVGGLLQRQLQALNIKHLCCDPFLENTSDINYQPLAELLGQCDVLCLHTPLTHDGPHPTHHLIGQKELQQMKPDAVLLNAGRGAVVDNAALLQHLGEQERFRTVLDVWENEPLPLAPLLERAVIATPHIAGYSMAGKWRGTQIIYQRFCQHFRLEPRDVSWPVALMADEKGRRSVRDYVLSVYDPRNDTARFKATLLLDEEARSSKFDELRKKYGHRQELPALVTP